MATSYTKLGVAGINLTKQKYFPDDQIVLDCQNAELVLDKTKGGLASLRKRGGLATSGDGFGAGLFGMFEIKFIEGDDLTPDGPTATETLRPDADFAVLAWDTVPIWSDLDETVASDADFDSTTTEPNAIILGMTNPVTPFTGAATAGTLRIRLKHDGVFDPTGVWTFTIYTNAGVTQLAQSFLTAEDSPTSFTTFELDIVTDMGYMGASFDWDDVQIYISPTFFNGNAAGTIAYVSWVELALSHV